MHPTSLLTKSRLLSNACKIKIRNSRSCQIATVSRSNSNITNISRTFNVTSSKPNTYWRLLDIKNRRPILSATSFNHAASSCRYYCAKKGDDGPGDHDEYNAQLPATVAVPEVWPHLPVIAINRNIVFPRFIKLIEV